MVDLPSINYLFIYLNGRRFSQRSFYWDQPVFGRFVYHTPVIPTVATAVSNASTVNAGLIDFIRREIALQAAQQPLLADPRPTTSTERNRLLAQRHIGRQQNDIRYVLPPTALLTDTELDNFEFVNSNVIR